MNKNISLSLLLAMAFCVKTSLWAGEVFLQDDFGEPASLDNWTATKGVEVENGSLTLKTLPDTEATERAASVIFTDHDQKLNFLQVPISVELDDLNLKGTAAEDKMVFMMVIVGDKDVTRAPYFIQLRVEATGNTTLWLYTASPDGGAQKRSQLGFLPGLQFPIKKIVITLTKEIATLLAVDSLGQEQSDSQPLDGASLDSAAVAGSELYLMMRAVSKLDPGTAEVSLGSLKVESGVKKTP